MEEIETVIFIKILYFYRHQITKIVFKSFSLQTYDEIDMRAKTCKDVKDVNPNKQ